jgi:xylulokinase
MILAFDIGTTSLKGGVIDGEGRLLARAETRLKPLQIGPPFCHEADANGWLSALALVTAQLAAHRYPDLAAVVVSGNGPTLVPADGQGRPLGYALTWMDRRAIEEAKQVSEASGVYIDPSFYLPKALWIFRHRPDIYERAAWFFPCPEFVGFHLTGQAHAFLPAPEFSRYIWTAELIGRLGMDPGKFPPFLPPARLMGTVRPAAEEVLGVPAGLPVVSGGPDFIMTLLGTGTVRPGRVCERAGTSEGINLCSASALEDPRLLSLPHIIPGCHNISGMISTSGKALEWFKATTGREELDYETFLEEVCLVPPGAGRLLFLPYLTGERAPIWDPYARGTFLGLTLSHGRREMTRAVLESVGFAIRDIIEVMEEKGLAVEDMRITGGQAKSPLWNQAKADITGKRVLITEIQDAELIGDACVALYALGRFGSLAEAAERTARVRRVYEPCRELAGLYDELFGVYRDAYRGLKEVFRRLSGVQEVEVE